MFTDDGEHLWVVATSSWSVSCGGGGEAVHVGRLDVATGELVGRFDDDDSANAGEVAGAGRVGESELNAAIVVPGHDAVVAWQSIDEKQAAAAKDGVVWRFEWRDKRVVATTIALTQQARPVRGGRSWLSVERGLLVQRAPGGGFVEDVAALPLLDGHVTLADDGRHVAVQTPTGLLLWDVLRARAVAWMPGASGVVLARSRALWRSNGGALRSATWVQLAGILPGLADGADGSGAGGARIPSAGGLISRVRAVILMLGADVTGP